MKNKHYDVKQEITDRLKLEKKRHRHTNETLAEYLGIEPQSVSRIFNGRASLTDENLRKLSRLWGVRKSYLLCVDNCRTDDDRAHKEFENYSASSNALVSLLRTLGYDIDDVEVFAVTPKEASALDEELLSFIAPHIRDVSKWDSLVKTAFNQTAPDYIQQYEYLIVADSELYWQTFTACSEKNAKPCILWLYEHLHHYSKISKNGKLLSLLKASDMEMITDTLSTNTASLFDALVKRFEEKDSEEKAKEMLNIV